MNFDGSTAFEKMGPFGISIYTRRNKMNVKNGTLDRFRALYEKNSLENVFFKKKREKLKNS